MPWHFWVIEVSVYLFASVLVRHAWAQGGRWLSTCFGSQRSAPKWPGKSARDSLS
jgi:hypothetical protein